MNQQDHISGEAWHAMEDSVIFDRLKASKDGLSPEEVESRRETYGENKLPEGKKVTLFEIILHPLVIRLYIFLSLQPLLLLQLGKRKMQFLFFL